MTEYVRESLSDEIAAIAQFQREIHLINDLKIKMLIDIDIMRSKRIQLNLNSRIMQIESCQNLVAAIDIFARSNANVKRVVRSRDRIVILSHTLYEISIKLKKLFNDRYFMFESDYKQNLKIKDDVYAHIVNAQLFFIQVRNNINRSVVVQRHVRLDIIVEYDEEDCFLIDLIENHLIAINEKEFIALALQLHLQWLISKLRLLWITISQYTMIVLSLSRFLK